jgi:hypothetical protein
MVTVDDHEIEDEEAREAALRKDDTIRVYSVSRDGSHRYVHVRSGAEVYQQKYDELLREPSTSPTPMPHLVKHQREQELKEGMCRNGIEDMCPPAPQPMTNPMH